MRRPPGAARDRALPRRGRVVLVGRGRTRRRRLAGRHRGRRPARHDAARSRTAELMAELSDAADARRDDGPARRGRRGDRRPRRGRRVGVRDRTGTDRRADALLVDADPWGGGIDLVLGSEAETGSALARPGAAGRAARATPRCATRCRDGTGSACCRAVAAGSDIDAGAARRGDRCGPPRRRDGGLRSAAAIDRRGRDGAGRSGPGRPGRAGRRAVVRGRRGDRAVGVGGQSERRRWWCAGPSPGGLRRSTSHGSSDCRCWRRCGRSPVSRTTLERGGLRLRAAIAAGRRGAAGARGAGASIHGGGAA